MEESSQRVARSADEKRVHQRVFSSRVAWYLPRALARVRALANQSKGGGPTLTTQSASWRARSISSSM
jgi:hypothetical protein